MLKATILLPLLPLLFSLAACSSSDLRDNQELDNLPLREATKSESARLKLCLQAVAHVQNKRKEKTNSYYERSQDIPTGKYCHDIKLELETDGDAYEVTAILRDDDYAVRWSINQNNVMEEQTDPSMNEDVDF